MEGSENSGLNSYYHNHHHHQNTTGTTANSGTNGLFSNPNHLQNQQQHHNYHQQQHNPSSGHYTSSSEPTPLVFPIHSVTGRAPIASSPPPPPPPETVRRKRGRPRKYGTSETPQTSSAAGANKMLSSSSPPTTSTSLPHSSPPRKKEYSSVSSPSTSSSKKSQLLALGQGFTPHVITVAAGEDVAHKIMSFMQQKKRAVCILSASGSISNASLRQPATLGGNVTYEGRFEILSLSGSYLQTEIGGPSSRTGGLSVCLSGTDGCIVGGGVCGPLMAAGPVQVIVGSFVLDTNKEVIADFETSTSNIPPSMVDTMISGAGFRSTPDPSIRTTSVTGNGDHHHYQQQQQQQQQHISGGGNVMMQPWGMNLMLSRSSDWRTELSGSTDFGARHSPEDCDD